MWILYAREPRPDARYWPGRRVAAAVDAIVWPAAWVLLAVNAPLPTGVVGPVVAAAAVLVGLRRLHTAVWCNARYQFTTWRWGRVAVGLMVVGGMLKVLMSG